MTVQDAEDLSFKKNDILVVVEQNEEKWWTAMDEQGNKGLIPEPYVKKVRKSSTASGMGGNHCNGKGKFRDSCIWGWGGV